MTPSSATGLEAAGVPFNTDGTIHMQDLGYWFGCPPGMRIDKFLEHVRTKYRADGEGAVAWLVGRPARDGSMGLYLPLLRGREEMERYVRNNPDETLVPLFTHPAPVAAQPAEGWVLAPDDLLSHLGDWETACRIALDHSEPPSADRDDHSYWQHQLRTIANIRATLASSPTPPTAPAVPAGVTVVTELQMTPFADSAPVRDEANGEQTILTYCEPVGTWDLAFFESGWEFPDKWLGATHWLDITDMWPGVIAQVASFSALPAQPNSSERQKALEEAAKAIEGLRIAWSGAEYSGAFNDGCNASIKTIRALATNPEPKL